LFLFHFSQLKLKEANRKLEIQKQKTEVKNKHITESITYAKRIQNSILGSKENLKHIFPKSFILFEPKDILSGDFYYYYECPETKKKVIVVADCTGHGVPAALMTVLGMNALTNIIEQQKILSPNKILSLLDQKIKLAFSNDNNNFTINDGMDATVLVFDPIEKPLFSGATNPVFIVKKSGETERIKGTKNSIGGRQDICSVFETIELDVSVGDKLYLFSDGFQDQFGGSESKKYMSKAFRETLAETSTVSMEDQKRALRRELFKWKGDLEQTDDIILLGIKI